MQVQPDGRHEVAVHGGTQRRHERCRGALAPRAAGRVLTRLYARPVRPPGGASPHAGDCPDLQDAAARSARRRRGQRVHRGGEGGGAARAQGPRHAHPRLRLDDAVRAAPPSKRAAARRGPNGPDGGAPSRRSPRGPRPRPEPPRAVPAVPAAPRRPRCTPSTASMASPPSGRATSDPSSARVA